MFRVRQTDCRTGWQVIDSRGQVLATFRRADTAREFCAVENKHASTMAQANRR